MSVAVEDRLSAAAASAVRAAINDAGGNEVFLLGSLDERQRVSVVRVIARGNRQAVPALLQVPRPGEVVIHNHPSGNLTPSDADLAVAAALGNNAVAVYIISVIGERPAVYAALREFFSEVPWMQAPR